MAQVKTVTTSAGENTITFDSFYPFVWIRNTGDNDITAANYSGAQAGAVNTVSIKAGEVAMIQAETENIYIIGATTAEIHAQGFAECPFKRTAKGGEQIDVTALNVTQNGTYTAPTGTAYSPVTVDVQEQPWTPLQDGYSNFWFELTDDTLSPWLNFSAKNADAVIDWGDGSGEVALDTLTPTHTYSKAGRYVVKVKGVTGIGQQYNTSLGKAGYLSVLKYVEHNSDVNALGVYSYAFLQGLKEVSFCDNVTNANYSFYVCGSLRKIHGSQYLSSFTNACFAYCYNYSVDAQIAKGTTVGAGAFNTCMALPELTISDTIASLGNNAFTTCAGLKTIHVQGTTPPTLGTNVFSNLPSDFIIYVPVGYGNTYKAAWSAYADHILEEGQTVTRAMQRKFAKEAKAIEEDTGDMR